MTLTISAPSPPELLQHFKSASRMGPDRSNSDDTALHLPEPPTEQQRDSYLSRQNRWLAPATFAGYVLVVLSSAFFVADHVWAVLLLIPLAVSGFSSLLSLVTSAQKARVTLHSHRNRVEGWHPINAPSIDVFLPTAGEQLAVLENTYTYVSRLAWPSAVAVYVLDDSGRSEVRALAEKYGFTYLSRPNRGQNKKAGNLRYGFDHSRGDLIAILDADFVPRDDLLKELAPYFDDPTVGIVQSPQFFDVTRDMSWLQRAAGSTQVLFYRYVQPSRDASQAAICVGTSAMYRRQALTASGGFALIDHSEDVHTGINLAEAGYETRYVATVVSKGACPDTFSQFVTQQYRWCNGSMSLLFSRRFHKLDLSLRQRACYWAGFLFYISTALDVLTATLPSTLMAYFAARQVTLENYIFVVLALVVRQALIPFITSERDSLVNVARIQTLYSFAHVVQLWDLLRGTQAGWVATGAAGSSRTATKIMRTARVCLVGTQIMLWIAIAWRTPEYGIGKFWPMIAFAIFNLYITFPIIWARETRPAVASLPQSGSTRSQMAVNAA